MSLYSLLYILGNILWTLYLSHPFLSSILTLHYYFLILLVTVIPAGMLVKLELSARLGSYIRFEILDTILLLSLWS